MTTTTMVSGGPVGRILKNHATELKQRFYRKTCASRTKHQACTVAKLASGPPTSTYAAAVNRRPGNPKTCRQRRCEWIPPPHLDHGQTRTNIFHHPEKILADEDDDDAAYVPHSLT